MRRLLISLLLVASAFATNYTVKSGGGGSFTTMAACATAQSSSGGDTCTVYAGTYNENVTVKAGTVGNYNVFTVNGSDVVTVQTFTLGSHTKLIGNCPTPTTGGGSAAGSCGFTITFPSSAGSQACVEVNANTDIYITNNVATKCGSGGLATVGSPPGNSSNWNCGSGMIHATDVASYIYLQGNTLSYPNYNPTGGPTGGTSVGIAMQMGSGDNASNSANHIVIENNDFSHYDLGVKYGAQYMLGRNNFFHDQLETEGCENQHSDEFFSEQKNNVKFNVIEGNLQRNGVGPNAKGVLSQGDGPCVGCTNLIIRFNITSRIGSGVSSNYGTWPHIVQYNNTRVDLNMEGSSSGQDTDYNDPTLTSTALLNNLYSYQNPSAWSNWNSGSCGSSCNASHNLYWCTASGAGCTTPYNHLYGGSGGNWTADAGNLHANPLFTSYVSPGSTSNDYHLQSGSPAIAAGTYLATVASGDSGSGTALVVNDATYFQDGYSLSNANSTVYGDCISVTTVGNHICITAVNYSTNTLTMASGFSRSVGDHVWLYSKSDGVRVLTGAAPDMGALPFSGIIPLVGCGPTIFYGPPNYPCGSSSTANPGQVSFYFQSTNPQWTGNTSNGAISPCTANCMQWVSGDQFLTSWQTGVGAGNGGNILLGGGVGHVNTSGTAITWVDGTPFSTAWSGTMTIAGVARTLVSCTSATACTVTVTPGTLTGAGYSVKGTAYGVSVWNSATVATLMSAPGTQTGVQMLDQTACKLITALDHTPAFGCQNAVSHDPTLPGYVSGSNLITQIADQGSSVNGLPVGNLTPSGGDNDRIWSKPNGTYLWIVNSGGSAQPMQISTASGYVQVVNSSTACPGYVPPFIPSAMSTGWLSDTRYYYAANGTQIFQGDLTGTGCTLAIQASPTMLVDVEAAGVCPGIPSGLTLSGIMGVGGNGSGTILDDTFTMGLNYAGGQGHGDWIVSWSRTRGCWTANLHTGQVWAFCTSSCTSSTPALGTMATGSTNCWGLDGSTGNGTHDQQTDGLGIYVFVSSDDSNGYTAGGCTGTTAALIQLQIGTLNNFWTGSVTLGGNKVIGNHQMVGITNIISNTFPPMTYSPMNNLPAYVTYANFPLSNGAPVHDIHQGLVEECTGLGSYSDSPCPIIGNTDTVLSTQLSGCTGSGAFVAAVYCPTAYSNMLTVMFPFGGFPSPLLTFAHSGSCGGISNGCADQIPSGFGDIDSIGVPSPKGDIFCWSSTMWHQLGYDRNAAPADEAFCMYFGQPKLAIAPATGLFAHVTKNFNAHFPISGGSK